MSRGHDREDRNRRQYEAEHTRPPRQHSSVFVYLVILVLAAFFLLLVAYLQQQRNNKAAIDSLQQSSSAVESLENLMGERDALSAQVDGLQDQLREVQDQLKDAQEAQADLTRQAQDQAAVTDALQVLNQIRYLYNRGRYQEARDLIGANPDLATRLATASAALSDEDRAVYDPLDAFGQLKGWLKVD